MNAIINKQLIRQKQEKREQEEEYRKKANLIVSRSPSPTKQVTDYAKYEENPAKKLEIGEIRVPTESTPK